MCIQLAIERNKIKSSTDISSGLTLLTPSLQSGLISGAFDVRRHHISDQTLQLALFTGLFVEQSVPLLENGNLFFIDTVKKESN